MTSGGTTPMTTADRLFTRTLLPTISGSLSSSLSHNTWLITTVGGAAPASSAGLNTRPYFARTPSNSNQFDETKEAQTRFAGLSPQTRALEGKPARMKKEENTLFVGSNICAAGYENSPRSDL